MQTANAAVSFRDLQERANKEGERRAGRAVGTRNKTTLAVKELAQQYGPDAILKLAKLAGLVKDSKGHLVGQAQSEKAQVTAIGMLLDRAYGKAVQPIQNDPDNPVNAINQIMIVIKDPAEMKKIEGRVQE